jgi:glycosyltransferase involved in cell wall biosynthesis
MLGGFSIPANYRAYRWARKNGKKVVVLTELSRSANGAPRKKGFILSLLHWLYRHTDAIFTMTGAAEHQFRFDFKFGNKVKGARYATDLDEYLKHPLREPKEAYTLLFANRLTDHYNPLAAIRILALVVKHFPHTKLKMNAAGELREPCETLIRELQLSGNVSFLDHISSWEALHLEYKSSDILLFPAKLSTGNFTVWEAMASGMGIVISDCILENKDRLEHGKNGFVLPLNDTALAEAVLDYIRHPNLLQQHGLINKSLMQPLGMAGTAALYQELITNILFPGLRATKKETAGA